MIEMYLLTPSKETDNKLRWAREIEADGTEFKLYIPKWRVPKPWPKKVFVRISKGSSGTTTFPGSGSAPPVSPGTPIRATLRRYRNMARSVRFTPLGNPDEWELGEPYIPYSLLPDSEAEYVTIEVHWGIRK
jgi:hypothetical protein